MLNQENNRFVVDSDGTAKRETNVEASLSKDQKFFFNQLEKEQDLEQREFLIRMMATVQELQKEIEGMPEEEQNKWRERILNRGKELEEEGKKRVEEMENKK